MRIAIHDPADKNEILLCSDGFDLTLDELIYEMSKAINKNQKVFFLPLWFLKSIFCGW